MMKLVIQHEHGVEFRDKLGESVIIRPYEHSKDRDRLVEMYVNFDPDDRCLGLPPLTREGIEEWIDYLAEEGFGLVAEHDGRIVGHVAVVPTKDNREVELDIFVIKDHQNRGIGQELLRCMIEFCRKAGYEGISLLTTRWNVKAIRIFRKFGFVIQNPNGFDEYVMYLKLR